MGPMTMKSSSGGSITLTYPMLSDGARNFCPARRLSCDGAGHMTDDQLVALVRRGDERAFTLLVERHRERLVRYATASATRSRWSRSAAARPTTRSPHTPRGRSRAVVKALVNRARTNLRRAVASFGGLLPAKAPAAAIIALVSPGGPPCPASRSACPP